MGASFEGFVVENVAAACAPEVACHFYRTSGGAEIDLLLAWPNGELWTIEVKRSLAPKVERGFHSACEDLAPTKKLLVYPGTERWPLGNDVEAIGLAELCAVAVSTAQGQ